MADETGPPARKRRWLRWVVAAAVVVVVLAVGGPFAYIHFFSGSSPAPLALQPSADPSAGTASPAAKASGKLTGRWQAGSGSQVGYRVQEVLFGQHRTAVGRTGDVTGTMDISGPSVTAAGFTVAMDTVKSDASQRDEQFNGRIMDTARYPTATFALSRPIQLGTAPAAGAVRHFTAHGRLTLRGQTRPVTFPLSAERTASGVIEVSGSIPVLFSTWDIPNPSFGGVVTTENHGDLEFLLDLRPS